MKKVLVIGGSGMLGHKIVQVLHERFDVWTTLRGNFEKYDFLEIFDRNRTFEEIEVNDFEKISNILKQIEPEFVINAVGVIKQQPSAKNVVETLSVNSIFPHKLAESAAQINFKLINVSTDCVFAGSKGNYAEDDLADAVDLYGKSKHFGEVTGKNCLTIRTSIIGRELESAHSLVEWFISKRGGKVKGFKNAIYSGFPTVVLAEIIADIIERNPELEGLYHISSQPINKFELLNLVNKEFGLGIAIEPDEEFVLDRSLNSAKFRLETGFKTGCWEEMIRRMAEDAKPYPVWRKRLLPVRKP